MLIDTHCHPNFPDYSEGAAAVIRRCLDQDIWLVGIGTHAATSRELVALAAQYLDGLRVAVGVHPTHLTETVTETDGTTIPPEQLNIATYRELAAAPGVVALGEVGLDYYRLPPEPQQQQEIKDTQRAALREFFTLSRETGKPLVIHLRDSVDHPGDAYGDFLTMMEAERAHGPLRGVVHCFGGTLAQAERCVALGLKVGITGIVTFKKADVLRQIVATLPLTALLTETDAPFLAPEPHRGKQNRPEYVALVAEKIAEIKKLTLDQVAEQTVVNARELFGF